jgi:hypothetical protein
VCSGYPAADGVIGKRCEAGKDSLTAVRYLPYKRSYVFPQNVPEVVLIKLWH